LSTSRNPDLLEFRLSLSPSLNTLRGLHYRAYARLRQKYALEIRSQMQPEWRNRPPLSRASIEAWRYSSKTLDWDNALAGLKPVVDCLLPPSPTHPDGLGLLRDDSPEVLPRPVRLEQGPAAPGKGYLLLRLSPYSAQAEPSWEAPLVRSWEFPELPPSLNQLRKLHFQQYRTLRQHWSQKFGRSPGAPLTKAWLFIETWRPRWLDWDNYYGGLKPLLDCLSMAGTRNPDGQGWILDDQPSCLAQPRVYQQTGVGVDGIKTIFRLYGFRQPSTRDRSL